MPQIVGTTQRDGYRVEKIIFESQTKHFVTGALYLFPMQIVSPARARRCWSRAVTHVQRQGA